MLNLRGQAALSIEPYQRAIALDPDSIECLIEIATVYEGLNRPADALAVARRAAELEPKSVAAKNKLGTALLINEQPDEAVRVLTIAVELDPTSTEARANLGWAFEQVGLLEEAVESFRRVLSLDSTLHRVHSNIIFLMPFIPGIDQRSVLNEARAWQRTFAEPLENRLKFHSNDRNPDRRLRIGYVSAHFYNHCQIFFTTPLFENHDHDQFEIYAYSAVECADEATHRLRKSVDVWRDVCRFDDAQLAEIARQDGVDILVDLAMHMGNGKLLALAEKPAPVQFCWLAYPGTTGLSSIDYRITDRYLDPPELGDGPYSERSVVLPDSFWCYDPLVSELECGPLPALTNGFITFGCLNHFRKI